MYLHWTWNATSRMWNGWRGGILGGTSQKRTASTMYPWSPKSTAEEEFLQTIAQDIQFYNRERFQKNETSVYSIFIAEKGCS
jgi:hypothetical protein